MSSRTQALDVAFSSGYRRALDFLELTKPRLVLMVLIATVAGYYMGSKPWVDYGRLLWTLVGTTLAAGGTLGLNQVLERDVDGLMDRTRHRPIPDGRIQPREALIFCLALTFTGLVVHALSVNLLCSLLTAFVVVSYLFIYTPLKQSTVLCTIAGAVPGALPPVIGWAAASGTLTIEAWVLFAILFLWQIPHTLAIARLYRDDFARAGIRLLPVVDPDGLSTARQVISHSLALLVASLLPTLLGISGALYFVTALILGGGFLAFGLLMAIRPSAKTARQLLLASLAYLPILFIVMALDRTSSVMG